MFDGLKYSDKNLGHHVDYIFPPLMQLIHMAMKEKNVSKKDFKILDIGCGNGSLTSLMAQQGFNVVGVESSATGVEIAAKNYPQCRFIHGSIYEFPFDQVGHDYDVVVSVEVIEHLFSPHQLLQTAKRCLKPGGGLILSAPYHGYIKNLAMALGNKFDWHFDALREGGHIKFFSPRTLTRLLQSQGYKDIQFKFAGRLPLLWKSMICYGATDR